SRRGRRRAPLPARSAARGLRSGEKPPVEPPAILDPVADLPPEVLDAVGRGRLVVPADRRPEEAAVVPGDLRHRLVGVLAVVAVEEDEAEPGREQGAGRERGRRRPSRAAQQLGRADEEEREERGEEPLRERAAARPRLA